MQGHSRLKLARDAVQRGTCRSINHRRYLSTNGLLKILLVKWTHQQNWLSNAGIAQGDGFVELHDCEARDRRGRLEQSSGIRDARSVAVVFNDREDWSGLNSAMNLADVVSEVSSVDLYPRVE